MSAPETRTFNPQYRERLFALIDGSPFVRHMGMRITNLAAGRATFEMSPAEFRLQPFGVVHGGNGSHGTSTLVRLPGLGVKLGLPIWAS